MTAEDIKWNLERILDPKIKSGLASRLAIIDSVSVMNRYTLKCTLKYSSGAFLAMFYGSGLQMQVIAPECVKEDGIVTHPIGTGPFEFVEWKGNDYIKVKKFKDYWGKGMPYLDEVILKPVPDQTVRFTALKTGDLDMTYDLPLEEVTKLMEKPQKGFYFVPGAETSATFIHFNVSKPPFNDVRVRQAVAYGINKKELLMAVYRGYGDVVNQPFYKKSPWYCDVPEIAQDINKAKALLKEAGYPDGLEVKLMTNNGYVEHLITAQVIQGQLKEIGMKIELDMNDWPTQVRKSVTGEYAFGVASWAPIADPDILYPAAFTPKGAYGFLTGKAYNNSQITEFIEQARAALDFKQRKELYTKAIKIVVEDAPWIFTTKSQNPYGIRSHVKGFAPSANNFYVYGGGGLQYTWLDK
jgi:peptide/nickel transport system substrate-binding protein